MRDVCYLHQKLNYTKGDVSGVLLDVKIGAFGDDDNLYGLFFLPLGIDLTSRAIIGADAGAHLSHHPDLHKGRLPFVGSNI